MAAARCALATAMLLGSLFVVQAEVGAINQAVTPNFVVSCPFSHRLSDDPIVHPGAPGAAHSHDFFGNTSTDAHATQESLEAAGTTCDIPGDTAAYWMPTTYQHGTILEPQKATVYYRNVSPDPAALVVFPRGLRMIGGDPHASEPQRAKFTGWACRHKSGRKGAWTADVPRCRRAEELVFRVRFPECWDGVNLDSADHQSHVARLTKHGRCPASHPVSIPRVSMTVAFRSTGGPGITLSSGSALTGHMDFVNSWDQAVLEELVEDCLRANRKCRFAADPSDDTDL